MHKYKISQFKVFITGIFLMLLAINSYSQTDKISVTLQIKESINKLPQGKDEWFSVPFICTIKNNSRHTLYIVNPEAYKIFPHPWVISVNENEARFWSGDPRCAPSFKKSDIIKLAPQDTVSTQFDWHILVSNFSKQPGIYKAKVRYDFSGSETWTMGADKKSLSDLKSNYSNEVTFQIAD